MSYERTTFARRATCLPPMRTLLAVLAAALCVLLCVQTARAAGADGGAPSPASSAAPAHAGGAGPSRGDAGAPPPTAAAAGDAGPSDTGDGGDAAAPPTQPAAPSGPNVTLPQTEAEKAEGIPIAAIEIVGNRRVGREDVLSYLREKPGHLFKVDNLTGDVHALWDSGFFEDIQVDLNASERGVNLRFIVREKPNIKEVGLRGQRRARQREAQRGRRDQAQHHPQRAGRAPQRAEDQGRLRREGLLPRRRRLHHRSAARERGHRQVQDRRAQAGHRPAHHVHRQRAHLRRRAPRHDARPATAASSRSGRAARTGRTSSSATS